METEKILLAAVAAAVVFWPQIRPMLSAFLPAAASAASEPVTNAVVSSKPVGSSRADWIADLIALQGVLDSHGQSEAASLVAQAAVKVIGTPTTAKK